MKLALLLPGFLDSPDYLHMTTFAKRLAGMGYTVERLDPCRLWETGDINNYNITNYISHIRERVNFYLPQKPVEIVLVGHSLGAFVSIVAGNRIKEVTKIVSLCSAPDRIDSALSWKGLPVRHSRRELPDDPKKYRYFDVPYAFAEDGFQYSAVEEVRQIRKPLMIFIALEDKVVPPELTEEIARHAHNPYIVRQPGMGHDFRFSQTETNLVMNEIEKFLKQLTPKS